MFFSVSGMNLALTLKTFGRKRTNLFYKRGMFPFFFHLHNGILKLVCFIRCDSTRFANFYSLNEKLLIDGPQPGVSSLKAC